MVCKEDVLAWFKDLDSYKRIDLMYELLNMCVPFEVRFLGSCIEEIGKHSYQELRGPAIIANDVEKLSKDSSLSSGLVDESTRHRTLIYLSLLSARNCTCANWFYKTLFKTDWLEEHIAKGKCKDENFQSELLLLFTMGLHHSAFTFDQKTYLGRILLRLLDQKEGKKQLSPKISNYCYPPGFGYPSVATLSTHTDSPIVPVKSASSMSMGDTPSIQKLHPPGLPTRTVVHPPLDFLTQPMWTRPPFPATVCGAPEVPPFPPVPTVSPLVSRASSPPSSRATSPQRIFSMRHVGHAVETVPTTQLHMEPLSSQPSFNSDVKTIEEEGNHIPDDKIRENHWMGPIMYEIKPPNGIRFPYCKYPHAPFMVEQMQAMTLEGENSLHCSSSSSRSGSPPDTPAVIAPQGPGRGEAKTRVNGIPPFVPPMCEAPPPPPPPFNNCSVPFSSYPHVTLTAIPNRSMFHYSQARFPFSNHFTYQQPPGDMMYPYLPVLYSSAPPSPRSVNCYNCGANGHAGPECGGQSIEDITQKAYTLEYNAPLPDSDKT